MKTLVTCRSDKFPPNDGEEEQINPGLWGRRLAEYLAEKLNDRGIATGEMNAEDWGWYLPVTVDDLPMALCCGHQNGDEDEFVVFTDPKKPVFRRWFRKVDATEQLTRLVAAVDEILRSDPDIRDVQWSGPLA